MTEVLMHRVSAPHSALAEMIVHQALLAIDPATKHIGGNGGIRDHELFNNTVWCNTKSGWFDQQGFLGYSGVNWGRARDQQHPKRSLDLVAIVPLRPEHIRVRFSLHGASYSWDPVDWYMVPASVLQESCVTQSKVRQAIDLRVVEEFAVTAGRRLDRNRLITILRRNQVLEGASPYEFL